MSKTIDSKAKVAAVISVLAQETQIEDICKELDVSRDTFSEWQGIYLQSALHHARASSPRLYQKKRSRSVSMGIGAAVGLMLLVSTVAIAQIVDCPNGLICFSPNTPAKANDVNNNFKTVHDWMVAKVGEVAHTGVQVTQGDLTVANNATVTGSVTTAGLNVQKTGQLSTISFPAETNDPGSITHFEESDRGELWLSSSDDWGSTSTLDKVIFGQYPDHPKFYVNSAGDVRVYRDLTIDGVTSLRVSHLGSGDSGGNSNPESYQITDSAWLALNPCSYETRGQIAIVRPSGRPGQDSLCYCGSVDATYEWWCLNP